jgi:hypothetical protein
MPQVSRIRFSNIGHPKARMDELVLDLTDRDAVPTNSTLWLRNGGGKSSLMNLFFSVLLPGKRMFLGARSENKMRELEDYILRNDRALVAIEWVLDAESGSLGLHADRLVTGVLHEWRGNELKQLRFCFRVQPGVDGLSLDSLPLSDGTHRFPLSYVKERLGTLRDEHPWAGLAMPDKHSEWLEVLDTFGIDEALFRFMADMNLREAGADQVFKFPDDYAFVDRVIETALRPDVADSVTETITSLREKLTLHSEVLVPQRKLVVALQEKLTPLLDLAQARVAVRTRLSRLAAEIGGLEAHCHDRIAQIADEMEATSDLQKEARDEARLAEERAEAAERSALALELWGAEEREAVHLGLDASLREGHGEAQRDSLRWEAAGYIHELGDALGNLKRVDEAIERRRREYQPLLEQVTGLARKWAAALLAQRQNMTQRANALREKAAETEASARDLDGKAQEHARTAARALTQAEEAERHAGRALAREEQLRKDGAWQEGEAVDDALRRQQLAQEDAKGRIDSASAHLEGLFTLRGETEAELRRLEGVKLGSAAVAAGHVERLEHYGLRSREVAEDDLLGRILELEEIDPLRLERSVPLQVRDYARLAEKRALELMVQISEHERAIAHLDNEGLLPPSVDVATVLDLLRPVRAWAGWAYLAENTTPERARELIHAAPAVAAGIVIHPEDVDKARALVSSASAALQGPVLLVAQDRVEAGQEHGGFVVGPSSSALFDKKVASTELLARRDRLERAIHAMSQERKVREDAEVLARKVAAFQEDFSAEWVSEQERLRDAAAGQVTASERQIALLDGRLEQIADQRREYERAAEIAHTDLRACDRHIDNLLRFAEDFPEGSVGPGKRAARLRENARTQEEARAQAAEDADSARALAASAREEAGRLEHDAAAIRRTALANKYVGDLDGIAPESGDADALGEDLAIHAAEYEGKVQAADLERERGAYEKARVKAQEKLDGFLATKRTDVDYRGDALRQLGEAALLSLDSPDELQVRKADAETRANSLSGQIGRNKQFLGVAQGVLKGVRAKVGGYPDFVPLDRELAPATPDEAQDRATELQAQALEARADARAAAATAADWATEIADMVAAKTRHMANIERIQTWLAASSELFAAVQAAGSFVAPEHDGAVESRLNRVSQELVEARAETQTLNRKRSDLAGAFFRVLDDAADAGVRSTISSNLRKYTEQQLESDAESLLGLFRTHIARLDEDIGNTGAQRETIVQNALTALREAYALLHRLEEHSRMPASLPRFAGVKAIRIAIKRQEDPAVERELVAQLVDNIASGGDIPTGIGFVTRALRRVTRGIEARVVYPDPDVALEFKRIPEIGVLSGGERLTCATILYCALAQLRALNRGEEMQKTGVLVMDNPFGSASRRKFIDVQREVASALGVQLVYTAAINDFDAVTALPNLIRLLNDRIDLDTGERLVELDRGTGAGITSVRQTRDEVESVATVVAGA